MFKEPDPKQKFPQLEESILKFWQKNNIFKKSIDNRSEDKLYIFYDGPPFATGLPHYGHILAGTIKDVIPRYATMKGYKVKRRFGWDCHGLPIENEIEKQLGLKTKKDIEKYGVNEFCEKCREGVLRYTSEWEKVVYRMGRWVDFRDDYKTMDPQYMESIWWVFKSLFSKKLIYEGHKSMHICPRCDTPLANFEVNLGYKDIQDIGVTVKFELTDKPKTFILAWTTTPWTLPGNVALAVGKNIEYVKVKQKNKEVYILAKDRVQHIFKDIDYKIIGEINAGELAGKKYKPIFDFYINDSKLLNKSNLYTIVTAGFVDTDEGTGVVHIACAFGEDDMELGKEKNLSFIQHVNPDGTFKEKVALWAGEEVKPKDNHTKTDKKIAEYLESRGLLFRRSLYTHSYPHCWRCDTPLLNYATNSLFVDISKIKKDMLAANEKINWVPNHLKHGRFGKWIADARDWAISRNRYWGTPIPIWKCGCGHILCIENIKELQKKALNEKTRIILFRHGETKWNAELRWQGQAKNSLNEKGVSQAKNLAGRLRDEKIDVVYSSDLPRAIETAEEVIQYHHADIIKDKRLRERADGRCEGLTSEEVKKKFPEEWEKHEKDYYNHKFPEGESWKELESRSIELLKEAVKRHKGKTILISAHFGVLKAFKKYFYSLSEAAIRSWHPKNTEVNEYFVLHLKNHPEKLNIDLHKHIVDEIEIKCEKCGKNMKRIPYVLDCWFESGSMPYAEKHYPKENKEVFEKNFPAQFIAEGLDQTRGWFYTLTALSAALFNEPAFLNVIVNGIVLTEDGRKMSKRLKNYPEPTIIIDKYGADALRFYLINSPVTRADDLCFSEKDVKQVVRSVIMPIWNSYKFFVMYANIDKWIPLSNSAHSSAERSQLDRWILSKLNMLVKEVSEQMEKYNLMKATNPIKEFINLLTNWYIRRSRRRFWKSENDKDKLQAYNTLYEVLITLSKIIAPFMPFLAEAVYKNLTRIENKKGNKPENSAINSVHLEHWPKFDNSMIDEELNQEMDLISKIVTLGHAARAKSQIKVRQPLSKIEVSVKGTAKKSVEKHRKIIEEELNVKEARISEKLEISDSTESDKGVIVKLDSKITSQLKLEGIAREIVRHIQSLRREAGYNIDDRINISISGLPEDVIYYFGDYIKKETLAKDIKKKLEKADINKETEVEGNKIAISVKR